MAFFYVTRGEFQTICYPISDQPKVGKRGVSMLLSYRDNLLFRGDLVALIQATTCTKRTGPSQPDEFFPSDEGGTIDQLIITAERWYIDAPGAKTRCPAFGMIWAGDQSTSWSRWQNARGKGDTGGDGCLGSNLLGRTIKPALIDDEPTRDWKAGMVLHHRFEVAAVCICSDRNDPHGTVLGAITWGYRVDQLGAVTPDVPVATNRPSNYWIAAATLWNQERTIVAAIPGEPHTWGE